MRAWQVTAPGVLARVDVPVPVPAPDELLLRVEVCGVCRTDLHVLDGDLPPHRTPVVPGHEAVGRVVGLGDEAEGWALGDRAGVAWLRRTCGTCADCRAGRENLCRSSRYTGWDDDGGYAEHVTVPAAYAYRWPDALDPSTHAPLLCAGIIGYRALRRAELPPGGVLGLYGFGGSAHLTAQVALAAGARVHVLTRGADARRLALDLGCASASDAYAAPPEPLDAAILFAPVGDLVPVALEALRPGGTLAVAGIHLSDVPPLDYQRHLFHERTLRSVEANTRADGRELLALAARIGLRVHAVPYPLDAADRALADLRAGRFPGAAVLVAPG
ncbi:propanol-preferring alcohol dehydrogenase [Isoptericola jiangsuensis]|uniref:Probable alcohol dehydrogenase AdhA n=1 Tax=Isoptericola jiangsuensis TaxID=548579 RepID=A0A2A9EX78_9MICO|nr:zinc-binding alcohol dehydrogenase family protein [Isoptericola jiangsuensis]PFG43747.1 propanol-preferring alcohol dehydrogenase [Isoptericola jiangsuensis]